MKKLGTEGAYTCLQDKNRQINKICLQADKKGKFKTGFSY